MKPIFLDKQDIFSLWEISGKRQAEQPFKNIGRFIKHYKMEHNSEYVPDMFEYNQSNKRGNAHPSVKLDVLTDFAEFFQNKIKIDENFIRLINTLPRENTMSSVVKTFKHFNKKYPEFFNQLTQAMDEKNIFIQNNIIAGWIELVKSNQINFKGQNLFDFILKPCFDETSSTVIKKIGILNRFDLDKTLDFLNTTLKQNEKNSAVIEAITRYYEQNNIEHNKVEIPIFQSSEQKLFHWNMKFQPEGVMQKLNLSEKDARNVLIWACYYLAEHAYGGVTCERQTGEEKKSNYNRNITLQVTTPYEYALQELKPIYEEALNVLFNSEFLTHQRLIGLQTNRYDEHMAKEFKEFIKPAKLQKDLSSKLSAKEEKSPKMKI